MVSFKASPVLLTWENESTVIVCVLLERSKEIDKKKKVNFIREITQDRQYSTIEYQKVKNKNPKPQSIYKR